MCAKRSSLPSPYPELKPLTNHHLFSTFAPIIDNQVKFLYNTLSPEALAQKLSAETFARKTVSFYRYVIIENPDFYRNHLYTKFSDFGILGRIYVAREGINAQISVPEPSWQKFIDHLAHDTHLGGIPLKIAVDESKISFYKLIVKHRKKIVADGLNDDAFDVTNVGTHLDAAEFNSAMDQPGTIVVDMRNHYESEVGHFKGAILPESDTFKEELPLVADTLKDKKQNKILLYCTGGIRCEKASAYLKHHGFKDVNQLHGGIISYAHQIKAEGLPSKFVGKNFVFDDRLGERITEDIISTCHQCGTPSDQHTNCANAQCHLLFIQCVNCATQYNGCCTEACKETSLLPIAEQRALRKSSQPHKGHKDFGNRLRPDFKKKIVS